MLYSQVYIKFGCDGRCSNNGDDGDQQVKKSHHDQVIKSILRNRVLLKQIIWIGRQVCGVGRDGGYIRHYKYNELTPKILIRILAYGTLKEKMEKGECLNWHEQDVQNMCSTLDDADLFKFFYHRLSNHFYSPEVIQYAASVGNEEIFNILEKKQYPLNLISQVEGGYLGLIKSVISNGNCELVKYMLESDSDAYNGVMIGINVKMGSIRVSQMNIIYQEAKSESKLKSYRMILKDLIQFITVRCPEFKSCLSLFIESPFCYLQEYGDRELVDMAKDVIDFNPSTLLNYVKKICTAYPGNIYPNDPLCFDPESFKDRKRKEVTIDKVEYIKYMIKVYIGEEELNNTLKLVDFDQVEPEDRPYFDLFAIYVLLSDKVKRIKEDNDNINRIRKRKHLKPVLLTPIISVNDSRTYLFQRVMIELKVKDEKQQLQFNRLLMDKFGVVAMINYGTLDQIQDVFNTSPPLPQIRLDGCYPRSVEIFKIVHSKYPDLITRSIHLFQYFIYIDSMELIDLYITLYPNNVQIMTHNVDMNQLGEIGIKRQIRYLVKLLPLCRGNDKLLSIDYSGITMDDIKAIEKIPECWEKYKYECKVEEDLDIVKKLFANTPFVDMVPVDSIISSCVKNDLFGILQWIVENHRSSITSKGLLSVLMHLHVTCSNKLKTFQFLIEMAVDVHGWCLVLQAIQFNSGRVRLSDYLKSSIMNKYTLTKQIVNIILTETSSNGEIDVIHHIHENYSDYNVLYSQ